MGARAAAGARQTLERTRLAHSLPALAPAKSAAATGCAQETSVARETTVTGTPADVAYAVAGEDDAQLKVMNAGITLGLVGWL